MLVRTHARERTHTRCIYTQLYAYIHVHHNKYIYRIYSPIVTYYKHYFHYIGGCRYRVIIIHVVTPLFIMRQLNNAIQQVPLA